MTKAVAKKAVKTKTSAYDVAEHLRTPEEMAAYLDAWLEEAPDGAGVEAGSEAQDVLGRPGGGRLGERVVGVVARGAIRRQGDRARGDRPRAGWVYLRCAQYIACELCTYFVSSTYWAFMRRRMS
jgi:hypothetical protein